MTIVCLPAQRTAETTQTSTRVAGPPAREADVPRRVPPSVVDHRWLEWAAVLVTDSTGAGVALCLI